MKRKRQLKKQSFFNCILSFKLQRWLVLHCLRAKPKNTTGPQIIKDNEPGTVRLIIRTVAKAFARGRDEKSGCYAEFQNFDDLNKKLDDLGMSVFPIEP